jgi:hypothetical protein
VYKRRWLKEEPSAIFQPEKIQGLTKVKKVFAMSSVNHREDFKNLREDFSKLSRRVFYFIAKTFFTFVAPCFLAERWLKGLFLSAIGVYTQVFTSRLKAER